jgi:hypothetical protein
LPTLNIENGHVYELAKALSERTGRSMTSVVEAAPEQQLVELDRSRDGIAAALMAVAREAAPQPADLPPDPFAELYHETTGLPR